jgi:hypothetical protein
MAMIVVYILIAWLIFTAGALVAAKMIGKRSWRDTVKWMLEFFS